ncbi:tetratricopeptide repeat protein, partial [Proteus mirabilis]
MAVSFDEGDGVEQDHEKAVYWYTKAGEQGDSDAQYNLAISYDEGIGIEQDHEKAVTWYTKAAEQGHADAQ